MDNWTTLERTTRATLNKVWFLDQFTGWVVGDSGSILKTTDGGAIWFRQESLISHSIEDVFFLNAHLGWAIALVIPDTTFEYGTILLRTSDGGNGWTQTWFPDDLFHTITFHDSLQGWFAGEMGRILRTTNGGNTWFPAEVDSSNVGSWAVRRVRFFNDNYGFGVGGRVELFGAIWRTTNGGVRWSPAPAGTDPILDVHYFDSLNVLGISGGFDDGCSLVRTTNGGGTWEYSYIGILGEPRAVSFRTGTEGWAPLGFTTTVMYTLDSGKTWTETSTPDNTAMYDLVFLDSLTGYMVGSQGTILKYQKGSTHAGDQGSSLVPSSIVLYPNFPNPFNPSTTLSYELPSRGDVTLTIFDGVGREVLRTGLGIQRQGMNTVVLDRGDLASGVYLYRIALARSYGTPVRHAATGKMLLLR